MGFRPLVLVEGGDVFARDFAGAAQPALPGCVLMEVEDRQRCCPLREQPLLGPVHELRELSR